MKIKNIILLVIMVVMLFVVVGCDGTQTVEQKQSEQTQQILTELNNQIGMPNIKEFYEKKMAKEIFELRDNGKLVTYAYFQAMNGKFIYLGECVGFGLPYSVQYTNPMKIERQSLNYGYAILPQADPNGLYMPDGLSATWLMYINPDTGEREIIYSEPSIVVVQSRLPRRLVEVWSLGDDYPAK